LSLAKGKYSGTGGFCLGIKGVTSTIHYTYWIHSNNSIEIDVIASK